MSVLRPTTTSDLVSLGESSLSGEVYFETTSKKIVVWDGSAWVNYYNDGITVPFANSYSAQFSGTNDYFATKPINRLNSAAWSNTTPITVAGWFNIGAFQSNGAIFGNCRFNPDGAFNSGYLSQMSGIAMSGSGDGSGLTFWMSGNVVNVAGTYSTNTWYHGAYTFDGSTKKLYINKELVFTGADNSNTFATTFHIYAGGTGRYGNYPDIKIDELALWDSALSQESIEAVYNGGAAMNLASLSPLAWYRMGDGAQGASGDTIYDASGNSNADGILFNGPTYSNDTI